MVNPLPYFLVALTIFLVGEGQSRAGQAMTHMSHMIWNEKNKGNARKTFKIKQDVQEMPLIRWGIWLQVLLGGSGCGLRGSGAFW